MALVVAGVAGMLGLLRPLPGGGAPGPTTLATWAAAGLGYGLAAALLKVIVDQLGRGWAEPLRHPALHAVCLLGPVSILLSQYAFRRGRKATPGVAVVLVVDPLVGVATGVLWFGEQLVSTPVHVLGALGCAVAAVVGIVLALRPGGPPVTQMSPTGEVRRRTCCGARWVAPHLIGCRRHPWTSRLP